ncbi:DNA repair protein [Oopsacas minuta]|uniref:DNA repair protein n=1 Tax=Oopsacas minuta TaxID=111878 RepID=A0AAV7JPB0_9METZ|nr:DNA repair protein [Oopsacas minuta]
MTGLETSSPGLDKLHVLEKEAEYSPELNEIQTQALNEDRIDSLKRPISTSNIIINSLELDNKRIRMNEPCYVTYVCIECLVKFSCSYLLKSFNINVCDNCKDTNQKYNFITATQVRQRYLLTDRHMADDSTGKLLFIEKRNPRNSGWSRMKLFLEYQVREKAFLVWGGEEGIQKEEKKRREISHNIKRKKYQKEMKKLRSSLKEASASFRPASHEHSYGPEELVDSETDKYNKICVSCGYVLIFEKL